MIYVASSWRNDYQPIVVQTLRNVGFDVYDFKKPDGDTGFAWSSIDPNWESWTTAQFIRALNHPVARAGFDSDRDAMIAADTCVLVLPCGRSAHAEAGWMAGAGRRVYVYVPAPERIEPELMYNLFDGVTSQLTALIDWVKRDH